MAFGTTMSSAIAERGSLRTSHLSVGFSVSAVSIETEQRSARFWTSGAEPKPYAMTMAEVINRDIVGGGRGLLLWCGEESGTRTATRPAKE